MIKIYLAGGLVSGWQNRVIDAVPEAEYFNPLKVYREAKQEGRRETPAQYVKRDVDWIRACDIVFCYQEKDLPETCNCSWEMGFGQALDKRVIYVNERVRPERYASMVSETCQFYTTDFQHGLDYLIALVKEIEEANWCGTCGGSGLMPINNGMIQCPVCKGTGKAK